MTTNTADRAVIGFLWDYNDDDLGEPRIYQISDGGLKTSKPVARGGPWSNHRRLDCCPEVPEAQWVFERWRPWKLCTRNWLKKTIQTQRTRRTQMMKNLCVSSLPHPYPGKKVCHYMMNKVHYMSYHRPDGRRYKLTDVICRMCQLREYGSRLKHSISMPGGNIVTDAKFLQLLWNIFPKRCRVG